MYRKGKAMVGWWEELYVREVKVLKRMNGLVWS